MVQRKLGLAYGSVGLFSAILHNVFLLYHVEIFVSMYKIDKRSFWFGETIFLIWNSCNDPLFGWLSDKGLLISGGNNKSVILRRIKALRWNGILLSIAFMSFWESWTIPALQFVICLCLYDSFLTMVDLHHNALLADMTASGKERTNLNFYCSIFCGLGSLSVFLSYAIWRREDMFNFKVFCSVLAVISLIGFYVSTKFLEKYYKVFSKHDLELEDSEMSSNIDKIANNKEELAALKTFIGQLSGHSNFIWFACMNLVQVFHCHFNSNFFPLFLESLLGNSIPQIVCSLILGLSFVMPHINNLYFLQLCQKYSVYSVVRGLFCVKLVLSLVVAYMGPGNIWVLCIFIASNRVFTEGTCKLLTLVISDLVDEDLAIHHRKQAVSALMFGTAALLTKPGQTLAPLIGTWLLSVYTGHDVFMSGSDTGSLKMDLSDIDLVKQESYRLGVFHLLVYIPTVCAILQLLAWSQFSLRGKRLQWVKSVRAGYRFAAAV